jgi:hypothetical protein
MAPHGRFNFMPPMEVLGPSCVKSSGLRAINAGHTRLYWRYEETGWGVCAQLENRRLGPLQTRTLTRSYGTDNQRAFAQLDLRYATGELPRHLP